MTRKVQFSDTTTEHRFKVDPLESKSRWPTYSNLPSVELPSPGRTSRRSHYERQKFRPENRYDTQPGIDSFQRTYSSRLDSPLGRSKSVPYVSSSPEGIRLSHNIYRKFRLSSPEKVNRATNRYNYGRTDSPLQRYATTTGVDSYTSTRSSLYDSLPSVPASPEAVALSNRLYRKYRLGSPERESRSPLRHDYSISRTFDYGPKYGRSLPSTYRKLYRPQSRSPVGRYSRLTAPDISHTYTAPSAAYTRPSETVGSWTYRSNLTYEPYYLSTPKRDTSFERYRFPLEDIKPIGKDLSSGRDSYSPSYTYTAPATGRLIRRLSRRPHSVASSSYKHSSLPSSSMASRPSYSTGYSAYPSSTTSAARYRY